VYPWTKNGVKQLNESREEIVDAALFWIRCTWNFGIIS
jgi:hypothetical protein